MIVPIKLIGPDQRERAKAQIDAAPDNWWVTIKEATRTIEQNNHMWAVLEDISRCEPLGWKYQPHDWKAIIMQALGWEIRFLPCIDGTGHFPAAFQSSRMTIRQMSDMITYSYSFGDEKGVKFTAPRPDEFRKE